MAGWYDPTPREAVEFDQELLQIDVAEAVVEAMQARGITKAELARRCGITRSALTQRLSGRKTMTLRTVAEMMHFLDYRLDVKGVDKLAPTQTVAAVKSVQPWAPESLNPPQSDRGQHAPLVWR